MNILLVDPVSRKYPNLALMKISTYHKRRGDVVFYQKGYRPQNNTPNKIYISTIFTYKADKTIKVINKYQDKYPNAEIRVGGIYATLMPDHLEKNTGIRPHIGLWDEVEYLPPDYSLFNNHKYNNTSFVFTTRGCPNNCNFCAVKTLEPKFIIRDDWTNSIDLDKPNIMIHDNNLISVDFSHFKDVMSKLKEYNKKVTFDNGFDCRLIEPKHIRCLKDLRIKRDGIRMAFDTMAQDGYIQDAINMMLQMGIPKSKIMVYVLFNYKDDLEEALYRSNEIRKAGAKVYPQRYVPLDWTDKPTNYIGPKWTKQMVREFRFYWLMHGFNSRMSFDEYLDAGGEQGLTG
ncbi:MAG: hypothetical protein ACOCRX_09980 [Candidatus Woesearchaeota archaeon]